ncbi:MAG: ABC transporter six-transmembrane domain-containing protein [Endozoicomonas sp.]|uniref:ABC transporter six-transmembrane domain-containing protein n=1 Tax=Endozoicomonas sp. TaxID=1892382 RepID=UPI003D9B2D90
MNFLEEEVPELITACVQILVALVVLASFSYWLSFSVLVMSLAILLIYAGFHKRIYRLNGLLNSQSERQVGLLQTGRKTSVVRHFRLLTRHEVALSDTDAVVYGMIFILAASSVLFNLWVATQLLEISAGTIFTVVSYSWEFVGAVFMLPMALQSLTRLWEISDRLNNTQVKAPVAEGELL